MPVVFRRRGLSYFFYSNEGQPPEPPHIHIRGGGRDAKIWLEPEVSIDESYGFNDVAPDTYPVALRVWQLPSCTVGAMGQGAEPSASAAPWPDCGEKFAA